MPSRRACQLAGALLTGFNKKMGRTYLRAEAAVPDGIGAALPPERAGRAELRCQSAECALARLQQQLPARPLPREVGQHQRHVLVGVRLLTLAVQKALQQHCAAAAGRTAESAPSKSAHIFSTLRSSGVVATLSATSRDMSCRVHLSAAFRCSADISGSRIADISGSRIA